MEFVRSVLAVVLIGLGVLAAAPAAQRPVVLAPPARAVGPELQAYIGAVSDLLASSPRAIPESFLARDADWLDKAAREFWAAAMRGDKRVPPALLRGAIVLHMTAALSPRLDRTTRGIHFRLAASIVEHTRPILSPGFQRAFLVGSIWLCQAHSEIVDVFRLLDSARRRYGGDFDRDPDLLLALTTGWEAIASLRGEERPTPRALASSANRTVLDVMTVAPILSGEASITYKSSQGIYRECVRLFEKVLRLSPGLDEARVRLARAHIELGEHQEAVDVLSSVRAPAADAQESPVPYLAALFRGRALLGLGNPDAALSAFDTAASLCPRCQAAMLGRSQALRAAGDARAAEEAVRLMLSRPAAPWDGDPWRDYLAGQWWKLKGLLPRMLAEEQP